MKDVLKCSKRAILGIFFNVLGITLIAHIISNYLYIYLYILSIFIIYIIYNTIYAIHCNIAYSTLPKKINCIFIIYNTIFLPIFQIIGVEASSKPYGYSTFYPTKRASLMDKNSHILANGKGELPC